jgi:hypothetical protein
MELTDNDVKLIVAASAAVGALSVALLSAVLARIFAQRDRRRQMYGEAFRAALEWREMVYRVRRRDNSDEHNRVLVDKFHDLQERLDFYEGWIGSESKYMRRNYRKLVTAEKSSTASDLKDAWDNPGKKGNADGQDAHPTVNQEARDAYLRDVRAHLSLQPWRWPLVMFRNWSES